MKTPKEAVRLGLFCNLIRPGTLAVRLTANIIAGHLLLTLLGNNGPLTEIRIWYLAMFQQTSSHLQAARIIALAIYTAKLFLCVAAHLSYPIVCVRV
jgi:F0F1-type ATP synthase membrane subunit a